MNLKKNCVLWNVAYINSKMILKNPKKIVHNFNENGEYNNEWDDL
jgi:hypothetical protein